MYQFDKIKLVIWDLDETFWRGTLSEEGVIVPEENKKLVQRLTDIGIVNAICSKNDWEPVRAELEKQGMLEYFVFPSVNWEAKGNRVKQLIENMQLRPVNVLFLDDNPSNREEVRFFCPDIMTEDPEVIEQLIVDAENSTKKDFEHKRLKQYKVLETKNQEKAQYVSNEEFLMESNIRLTIAHDCLEQLDRIHDLILRSNQLNFTKLRSSKEELKSTLEDDNIQSGYVSVVDRYGDYGIVGFYALQNRELLHFTFSCRTLGMGIEQYVYNKLKRPTLEVVGEVISDLTDTEVPKWINQNRKSEETSKMAIQGLKEHAVLVKGPCDLFQVYPYIAQVELFDTEFTYTTDSGLVIESTGHTTHIVEAHRLSKDQKEMVLSEVPFTHEGMYNDAIFTNNYKVVFISILTDANLGVYRRKSTGERFVFLEYRRSLTDEQNWPGYISGEYDCRGFQFTEEILREFSEKYEYVGRNTSDQIVENLRYIRTHLPQECTLVVMLGGELYYEKNTSEAYKDRHLIHKEVNDKIRAYAQEVPNLRLLDVNKYLVDQSSFYDHFNHYIKPVYYKLAEEMVSIVNDCIGIKVKPTSKFKMVQVRIKEMLAPLYYKVRCFVRR